MAGVEVPTGVASHTVAKWRACFVADWINGLVDEPWSTRVPVITVDQVEEVIVVTLESVPVNAMHWSRASMVECSGHRRGRAIIPTGSSWTNQFWRWLTYLTQQLLQRSTHKTRLSNKTSAPRPHGTIPTVIPDTPFPALHAGSRRTGKESSPTQRDHTPRTGASDTFVESKSVYGALP